jgi:hypothetical protein
VIIETHVTLNDQSTAEDFLAAIGHLKLIFETKFGAALSPVTALPVADAATIFGATSAPSVEAASAPSVEAAVDPLAGVAFPVDAETSTTVPAAPPVTSPMPPSAPLSAPPPPTAVATPPPVELDVRGIPWDDRIHSGGRAKNKDGTWRNKRGVPGMTVEAVEKDLLARSSGIASVVPLPPPSAASAVPAPPVATPEALTFVKLIARIQDAISKGTLSKSVLLVSLQEMGIPTLADLNKRPDLFQTAIDKLKV